jgi:hypothetical protein
MPKTPCLADYASFILLHVARKLAVFFFGGIPNMPPFRHNSDHLISVRIMAASLEAVCSYRPRGTPGGETAGRGADFVIIDDLG